MPLKKGSSQETMSGNIRELVHDWEKTGDIGNSRPETKQKAVKQAVAIALDTARESGGRPGARKVGTSGRGTSASGTRKSSAKKSSSKVASRGASRTTASRRKSSAMKTASGTSRRTSGQA